MENIGEFSSNLLIDSKLKYEFQPLDLCDPENLALKEFNLDKPYHNNLDTKYHELDLAIRKEFQLALAKIYPTKDIFLNYKQLSIRLINFAIQFYRIYDSFLLWERFQASLICSDLTKSMILLFLD